MLLTKYCFEIKSILEKIHIFILDVIQHSNAKERFLQKQHEMSEAETNTFKPDANNVELGQTSLMRDSIVSLGTMGINYVYAFSMRTVGDEARLNGLIWSSRNSLLW